MVAVRRKGVKSKLGTYCISKPSKWGNPFVVGRIYKNRAWLRLMYPSLGFDEFIAAFGDGIRPTSVSQCYRLYKLSLKTQIKLKKLIAKDFQQLANYKGLTCWCKYGSYCHYFAIKEVAAEHFNINL